MSALELLREGKLSVARAVSHTGEQTLGLCVGAIHAMEASELISAHCVVSDVEPVSEAFNRILDFARKAGADALFHTASDVVVDRRALVALLGVMDMDKHYQAVGKGYDPMFGEGASVGILVWNMRAVGDLTFRDVYKTDMDMSGRVEAATGLTRVYPDQSVSLGYHHPIWTAEELYNKIIYSFRKYGVRRKLEIEKFVADGLARNPRNSVFIMGGRALERARNADVPTGAKSNSELRRLYEADRETAGLPANDPYYYVHHSEFRDYAQAVFRSDYRCRTVDEETWAW